MDRAGRTCQDCGTEAHRFVAQQAALGMRPSVRESSLLQEAQRGSYAAFENRDSVVRRITNGCGGGRSNHVNSRTSL